MKLKEMNLPNKLSLLRVLMALIVIFLLLFPFYELGFEFPKYLVKGIYIDSKLLISGVVFIIASITDYLDGKIARARNLVTDFGKTVDAIADKLLVNSTLIILAAQGYILPIIPVIVIGRDGITNAIKMVAAGKGKVVAASNLGKLKTASLMVGIVLTMFYNMPFEFWNIPVSDFLLIFAALIAIAGGFDYYNKNKEFFTEK